MISTPGYWAEFEELHGEGISEPDKPSWAIYPDGARRELTELGFNSGPPNDEHKRMSIVLRWHTEKLRRATNKFLDAKASLRASSESAGRSGHPPPPDSEFERLKELRSVVRAHSKNVEDARQKLEDSIPPEIKHREKLRAENRQKNEEFKAILHGIKV